MDKYGQTVVSVAKNDIVPDDGMISKIKTNALTRMQFIHRTH